MPVAMQLSIGLMACLIHANGLEFGALRSSAAKRIGKSSKASKGIFDDGAVDADDNDGASGVDILVTDPIQDAAAENVASPKVVTAPKVPVGLFHAGPWNKSHVTMTVSDTFDCPYNKDSDYDSDDDSPEMNVRCAELELLVNDVQAAEKQLHDNLAEQEAIATKLQELSDEDPDQIRKHEEVVSDETQSEKFGTFLGQWWREMRMFAGPFYSGHLDEKRADLEEEETEIRAALKKAKKAVRALKAKYAKEDEERTDYHTHGQVEIDRRLDARAEEDKVFESERQRLIKKGREDDD